MNFNPWHSVSYGDNVPNTVNAVIEIPRNCTHAFIYDPRTLLHTHAVGVVQVYDLELIGRGGLIVFSKERLCKGQYEAGEEQQPHQQQPLVAYLALLTAIELYRLQEPRMRELHYLILTQVK